MALYVCKSEVKIDDFLLKKVSEITVSKSVENGDFATVKCSLDLTINGQKIFKETSENNRLKTGQKIEIKLGWDVLSDDYKHFTGFIKEIKTNRESREIEILCEDYNYILKQVNFNFSQKSISLKKLGNKIINEVADKHQITLLAETELDFSIQKFIAEKSTAFDILKHLKDEYNIVSTFVQNRLIIGVNFVDKKEGNKDFTFSQIPDSLQKKHGFKFLKMIDTNNLIYKNEEDVEYSVTANIINRKNEKTEYTLGDLNGSKKEFWFYGEYNKTEVEKLVENELKRVKYRGFQKGSNFQTFGKMDRNHNERGIEIFDSVILDGVGFSRDLKGIQNVLPLSKYLVKGVEYTYSANGFFANVELGQNLDYGIDSGLWDMIEANKD